MLIMPSLSNVPGCHCGSSLRVVGSLCAVVLHCFATPSLLFSPLAAAPLSSFCVCVVVVAIHQCVWTADIHIHIYIYAHIHTYMHMQKGIPPPPYHDALLRVLFKRCDIHSVLFCALGFL